VNADDLKRWRADVCSWAEANVWVRSPDTNILGPLRLQEHQRAWLTEATMRGADGRFARQTCVASWPKREGKSLCSALVLAWRLTCYTNQRAGIIANSERQAASVIFDALTGILRDSPALQDFVPEDCIQARKLSVPALENVAECYPANWRTVQGVAFDVLASDELHASDDGGKAWTFASQQTEATDAQVIISSQAGAPVSQNPLWRLHKADDPSILFDYRTEPVTPWAVARAEKARAELLPGEFDLLWRNAWGATGLKLFAAADVEAAALPYTEPATAAEWEALKTSWGFAEVPCVVGVGLDRAGVSRRGDRTVWIVCARFDVPEGEPVFRLVRCAVQKTGSEGEVLTEDRRTREVFGQPAAVLLESYGCSDLAGRIDGATLEHPTAQRQQGLFNRLSRLFVEGRIGFPADAGTDPRSGAGGLLKAELVAFEYDAEREGLTRFGTQSGHDDTCYSLAWSCEAVGQAGHVPWWQDPRYGANATIESEEDNGDDR